MLHKEKAIDLYRSILKIRRVEEKVAEIYPTDKIQSPIHLCIGQEAVSAGVSHALGKDDHIYGTYRGHGVYIARGGNLKKLFAELYAKDPGCAGGRGGSMHVIAPEVGLMGCSAIVASTIPVAVGDALASKMQGRKRVAVAFFGDGALGEGVFFESINFAALKNLPIIFVCENNNYAVHSKVSERYKQTDLYRFGETLGVSGKRFDGNDSSVVYSSMADAVEGVRAGGGPVFLEYVTYRWYEHVGPGKDHREIYRDQNKLKDALNNDPLEISKKILTSQFSIPSKMFEEWEGEVKKEITEAVQFAESAPFPKPSQLYENLFAEK